MRIVFKSCCRLPPPQFDPPRHQNRRDAWRLFLEESASETAPPRGVPAGGGRGDPPRCLLDHAEFIRARVRIARCNSGHLKPQGSKSELPGTPGGELGESLCETYKIAAFLRVHSALTPPPDRFPALLPLGHSAVPTPVLLLRRPSPATSQTIQEWSCDCVQAAQAPDPHAKQRVPTMRMLSQRKSFSCTRPSVACCSDDGGQEQGRPRHSLLELSSPSRPTLSRPAQQARPQPPFSSHRPPTTQRQGSQGAHTRQ